MNRSEFVAKVIEIAHKQGFQIEDSRNGKQIDFVNKKLHEVHLNQLFDLGILNENANVNDLIDKIAPGRPCTHKPMTEIIAKIRLEDCR